MKKIVLALVITTALSAPAFADSPAVRQTNTWGYVSTVSQPVETRSEYAPNSESTYKEHAHKHHGHHHHKKDHKDGAAKPHHHHHHHKHDAKKDVKTDVKQ